MGDNTRGAEACVVVWMSVKLAKIVPPHITTQCHVFQEEEVLLIEVCRNRTHHQQPLAPPETWFVWLHKLAEKTILHY